MEPESHNHEGLRGEFEKLLNESGRKIFREGDLVKGRVMAVNKDAVVVDIGFKSEGVVPAVEFRGPHGEMTVKEGDEIEILLESLEDDNGLVVLSKERADALKTWGSLVETMESDGLIEGVVIAKVKGGLSVDIGVKAFLPASQIDVRPVQNLDRFVGRSIKCKILKLNRKRGNVILSRRALLEGERSVSRQELLENLHEGSAVEGVVKNVTDYGVFVDLGGVDGLVHISDLSWGKPPHPAQVYGIGDDVRVKILKVDRTSGKVSLGVKQLQEDPWRDVASKFEIGGRIKGKVTGFSEYGAFVMLADGIEGMIHVSEMSWTKKIRHPSKVLAAGEMVEAMVLGVDEVNHRITLGLKQLQTNPWERVAQTYQPGMKLKGKIKNILDFGLFVAVPDEEVEGLVHVSDLSWTRHFNHPTDIYKKGDEIEVQVLNIDKENGKFSLGIKQLSEDPWPRIDKEYKLGEKVVGTVARIVDWGIVVELESRIFGVIPIGELNEQEYGEPGEGLKEEDAVEVIVTSLNPAEAKINLTLVGKTRKKAAAKKAK